MSSNNFGLDRSKILAIRAQELVDGARNTFNNTVAAKKNAISEKEEQLKKLVSEIQDQYKDFHSFTKNCDFFQEAEKTAHSAVETATSEKKKKKRTDVLTGIQQIRDECLKLDVTVPTSITLSFESSLAHPQTIEVNENTTPTSSSSASEDEDSAMSAEITSPLRNGRAPVQSKKGKKRQEQCEKALNKSLKNCSLDKINKLIQKYKLERVRQAYINRTVHPLSSLTQAYIKYEKKAILTEEQISNKQKLRDAWAYLFETFNEFRPYTEERPIGLT